jgi:hypothetical protein
MVQGTQTIPSTDVAQLTTALKELDLAVRSMNVP